MHLTKVLANLLIIIRFRDKRKFVWCGTELGSYLETKIKDLIPYEIKQSETPNAFKLEKGGSLKDAHPEYANAKYIFGKREV